MASSALLILDTRSALPKHLGPDLRSALSLFGPAATPRLSQRGASAEENAKSTLPTQGELCFKQCVY